MADNIFEDKSLYHMLIKSKYLTVIDRAEYFRLWYAHPSAWPLAIIRTNRQTFLDIRGRMGHTFASANAQALSSLWDLQYNMENDESHVITLIDDTFILNSQRNSFTSAHQQNMAYGFKLNPSKSQIQMKCVKWSGYHFDVDKKSLKLPNAKIDKIRRKIDSILTASGSTRRNYASILSSFYSARLIIGGIYQNLSSILFMTRKWARLDSDWFWSEEQLTSTDFDEIIKRNPAIQFELELALDILRSEASFESIRKNINFITRPVPSGPSIKVHNNSFLIFMDASSKQIGIWLRHNQRNFMYSEKLREQLLEKSINFKELYTLCKAITLLYFIQKQYNLNPENNILYVDNEVAKIIAIKRRVTLKDVNIYQLAQFLSFFFMATNIQIEFQRIDTTNNCLADYLSRGKFEAQNSSLCLNIVDEFIA